MFPTWLAVASSARSTKACTRQAPDEALGPGEVQVVTRRGENRSVPADSVVLAAGYRANTELCEELRSSVPDMVHVGDCAPLGDLRKALEEDDRAGLSR